MKRCPFIIPMTSTEHKNCDNLIRIYASVIRNLEIDFDVLMSVQEDFANKDVVSRLRELATRALGFYIKSTRSGILLSSGASRKLLNVYWKIMNKANRLDRTLG